MPLIVNPEAHMQALRYLRDLIFCRSTANTPKAETDRTGTTEMEIDPRADRRVRLSQWIRDYISYCDKQFFRCLLGFSARELKAFGLKHQDVASNVEIEAEHERFMRIASEADKRQLKSEGLKTLCLETGVDLDGEDVKDELCR